MRNLILVLLVAGAAFVPIDTLTGVHSDEEIGAPVDLPAVAGDDVAPFFAQRDEIARIVVPEATTLRQFLDRNRLNRPWTRDQITAQLGDANPAAVIPAGTVFRLRLTPTVTDVPGTNVTPARGTP